MHVYSITIQQYSSKYDFQTFISNNDVKKKIFFLTTPWRHIDNFFHKTAILSKIEPKPIMPKVRKPSFDEGDPISTKMLEVLTDYIFLGKLNDMLFLATVMGNLEELIQSFDSQSAESVILKENVAELEAKVCSLENEVDRLEQYSADPISKSRDSPKQVMEKTL